MANLAQKYRPKTFDEITEQKVVVDIVSNICNSTDVLSNRNFLFIGPAGTGKAQPLDSSVLTPQGVKLMGDIKIGDQVVTGHGNIGNVTGIYPQGRRNIYKITLSDDSSIRVSDEHLNVFYTEDETTSERTDHCETTMQLISRFELNPEPLNIDCLRLIDDRNTGECSVEVDRWYRRYITSITYEGIEECQCIMIDHPDHTYVSDGLIPTHNTTTARAIGTALNGNSENIIEVDAASHSGVDSMREIIEQAKSYPVGSKYKIFILDEVHAFSPAAWQSALKTLEEQPARSIFLLCVTGDGLVPTNSGLKRMDMISVGDQVWDGEQFRRVDNVFDNGEQHCLKLTLKDGSSLTCTDDHQIEVLQGDVLVWKKAKDITLQDHLLVYNNHTNNSLGSDLSIEEAWMLGYITGNGNYTSHSLDLYTPFHKWDKVKGYLDSLVSKKIIKDYIVDSDKRAVANHIYDTRIHFFSDKYHPGMSQWYSKTGLDPNYTRGTKKIPNCIYSATPELIREFVEGWYYADGDGQHSSFFNPNPDIRISRPYIYCSNHDMLSSLQQILRTIGLYSSIHTQPTVITEEDYQTNDFIKPGTYQSYLLYLLNKPGYFDDDQFRSILLSKYNDMPSGKYHLDLANLKNPNRRISPKMIAEAGYDYSNKGRFMNVVSIEDAGTQHVYDIEVRDSHKFVYNGVVVHNCTTNPEKIPATIISRVQTFQLSKISLQGIYDRLIYIIEHENAEGRNITYDKDAILYLSKLAQGGMRDAITNLDQVLAYSTNITSQSVQEALSLPNYDDYFTLLNAYAKKQNEVIVKVINDVYNSGVNFIKWFEGFFSFVTNIVKYIYTKDINSTMIPSTYQDKIQGYSIAHAALCLKLSKMLVKMIQELKGTQYLQELAITYLCTPQTAQKGQ